jgi:uncharacterized protein
MKRFQMAMRAAKLLHPLGLAVRNYKARGLFTEFRAIYGATMRSRRLWGPISRIASGIALCAILLADNALSAPSAEWATTWNDALFTQAAKQHRFILLDLHAVWCHWCHIMDDTTYQDAEVQRLIREHYVPISVDADSDPDLTSRYGDWGWPATIVLSPDGTEIVKRRGYMPPRQMASLLKAIVDDPSPGPSVRPVAPLGSVHASRLTPRQKAALVKTYDGLYDVDHGGWGEIHKLIDADTLELAFSNDETRRARTTLDNNLQLIDPIWGGVYQYSDSIDWRSPHFEKLMSYQADDLRLYAEAYTRWHDARYLNAANSLYSYVDRFLTAPDGGFYVSQDADLSGGTTGHEYYALDDAQRRSRGIPKIDTHRYARETGWAVRALAKYYDVTGNTQALGSAERGARWALVNRALPGGGFRHDQRDRGGPFLDDNLAMAQGFVALYRSTGEREWLDDAADTLNFIDARLRHRQAGFIAAPRALETRGVFNEAVRLPDQNAGLARTANLVNRYTGDARFRQMALHAMKYLVAYAANAGDQLLPEILLADRELATAPIHIAIVGGKHDDAAVSLHAAALRYPADYLQIDWLDRAEGALPNPDIQYPSMERAAAYACANGACSSPVFEGKQIEATVHRLIDQSAE